MREPPRQNLIDRAIAWIAPGAGLRRLRDRSRLSAVAGGYKAGRGDRRATSGWQTQTQSPDAALLPDLPTIRDRSYDLIRNAPLAAGAVATVVTNVVGTGLKLSAQIDADKLELTDEQADEWEQDAEREYCLATETQEIDFARTLTFEQLQDVALRSVLQSGDLFVFLRFEERAGSPYGLKLQCIEGDRVSNPNRRGDTRECAGGVQIDPRTGAPVGYWVSNRHPGDLLTAAGAMTWQFYPAFAPDGRRQVLHLFKPSRFEQRRGVPYLAPVVEALKQLDRFGDAELMAAVMNACLAIVTQTDTGGPALGPLSKDAGTDVQAGKDSPDSLARAKVEFEAGLVIDGLKPNESIKGFEGGRPNAQFDPFVLAVLRQVGVALEIPYEVLIKHFTASYSAARAALLEAGKFFRTRRAWLADMLCQPVYEAVLMEAVARGRLQAPGFFGDPALRKAWSGAEWVGPSAGQIDPAKEADANVTMVERGWKTDAEVTAEMTGGDWDRKVRARARELKRKKELGLMPQAAPAVAPGQPPQPGQPQPQPQQQPPADQQQNPDQPDQEDAA